MGAIVSTCRNDLPDEGAVQQIRPDILFDAIQSADLDSVRKFVRAGLDVNVEDKHGRTPLHMAAEHGLVDIAEHLVDNGASLSHVDANLFTPLLSAAMEGHGRMVSLLVRSGADINEVTKGGYTPLHLVLRHAPSPRDVTVTLLELGADPDAITDAHETPLHCACYNPDGADLVDLLIRCGADINEHALGDITPLHTAVMYTDHACVTRILKAGADVKALSDTGAMALHFAAQSLRLGRKEVIREILLRIGDPDWVNKTDNNGMTPLHYAASQGQLSILELLISEDADVNVRDNDGRTALHSACISTFSGRRMICETLLEHGLKPDDTDSLGNTAFHCAAKSGNAAAMEALLPDASVSAIAGCTENQASPIHLAAASGSKNVVQLLIREFSKRREEVGIIAATNKDGQTALHVACQKNDTEVVKALLDAGASCTVRDAFGATPLHAAASCSTAGSEALETLLALADARKVLNTADRRGYVPLHLAAKTGSLQRVSSLVRNGCATDMRTADGDSAIMVASKLGHADIVAQLEKTAEPGTNTTGLSASPALVGSSSMPPVRKELIPGRLPSASKKHTRIPEYLDHTATFMRLSSTDAADEELQAGGGALPGVPLCSAEPLPSSETASSTANRSGESSPENQQLANDALSKTNELSSSDANTAREPAVDNSEKSQPAEPPSQIAQGYPAESQQPPDINSNSVKGSEPSSASTRDNDSAGDVTNVVGLPEAVLGDEDQAFQLKADMRDGAPALAGSQVSASKYSNGSEGAVSEQCQEEADLGCEIAGGVSRQEFQEQQPDTSTLAE